MTTYTVKPRDDGRFGVYDVDKACVGSEDSEKLARCHARGLSEALARIKAGLTDEEAAYQRGFGTMMRREIYPFGIVPEEEK